MTQKTSDVTTPQSGAVELFRQQFERWRRGLVRQLADIDDALTALESGSGDPQLLVRREGVDIGTRPAINLHEGTGITIVATDDNANGEVDITINSTISTYTDEQAQDAVANLVQDTTTVSWTYSDATNELFADVNPAGLDHGTIGGLGDDDHTQYLRTDGTRAGTGSQAWSSASPTITVGDGTGTPHLVLNKSNASTDTGLDYHNVGVIRHRLGLDGSENFGLFTFNASGSFVDGALVVEARTATGGTTTLTNAGVWQYPSHLLPVTDNAQDLGDATHRWRALYTQDVQVSGASMVTPSYVTLATSTALPNERVLTAGHGIDLPDAGAGSTITIDVDETELDLTNVGLSGINGIAVETHTSGTGTYTIPTGHTMVYVCCRGGGGGGGGGGRAASGTVHMGGAGGGAGSVVERWYRASDLSNTDWSVGAGGTHGNGATSGGGATVGSVGGNTTFSTSTTQSIAYGGGGGQLGSNGAAVAGGGGGAGTGAVGSVGSASAGAGGGPGTPSGAANTGGTGASGSTGSAVATNGHAEFGGGGGGGHDSTPTNVDPGGSSVFGGGGGGSGACSGTTGTPGVGPGAGGQSGSITRGGGGTAGTNGASGGTGGTGANGNSRRGGSGGGGGGTNTTAGNNAGAGGPGGTGGGGGGGGGACLASGASGNGGNGGDGGNGYILILSF